MKKVERINVIMRYINNRAHFTITEIMREFNISRSTAIRDIREIETMGMPLVAEVGRDGGYSVMRNSVLPEVRFTGDELKALFIAFMATRNQQLPYLKSRQSLAEKLLGLLSETQQEDLFLLNQLLFFEGTNPNNPDLLDLSDLPHPMLEKLIRLLLSGRYLQVTANEGGELRAYPIYLLHLYREKSLWLIEGFDLEAEQQRILPVDRVTSVEALQPKKQWSPKWIEERRSRQTEEMNLVLELGLGAIGQFKKYHPLKASLSYTNPYQTTAILRSAINVDQPEELEEFTNWLLFLGEEIVIRVMPDEIRRKLLGKLKLYSRV